MHGSPKIVAFSDVHLFHGRVLNKSILAALYHILSVETPNILIIAGDLFDRPTRLSNQMVGEVEQFIEEMLSLCQQKDIVLLMLEGTPSHDDKQGRMVQRIYKRMGLTFDFQYHEALGIGRVEKYDMDVLFVPDEWKHDPNEVWADVKSAMRSKGVKSVHLSVMHGTFMYQMPPMLQPICHMEKRYLGITTHYIFIGHHHRPSEYGRIRVPGSTVALEFGTGNQHGYWAGQIFEDADKDTMVFKAVAPEEPFIEHDIMDITDDEFDELLRSFETMRGRSHHRFIYSEKGVRVAQLALLAKTVDGPIFTFKKVASADEVKEEILSEDWEYKLLPLTRNELPELLISKAGLADGELDLGRQLLAELDVGE